MNRLAWAVLALALSTAHGAVVVEQVGADSVAAAAGLQPGERLTAWNAADRDGGFDHPLDFFAAERLAQVLQPITLVVEGDGGSRRIALTQVPWGIRVRPILDEGPLNEYQALDATQPLPAPQQMLDAWRSRHAGEGLWLTHELARRAVDTKSIEQGLALLESVDQLADSMDPRLRTAATEFRAVQLCRLDQRQPCADALIGAAEARQQADQPLLQAVNLSRLAALHGRMRKIPDSARYANQARELLAAAGTDSVAWAQAGIALATANAIRGDLSGGARLLRESLDILERRAPGHQGIAGALNNLGIISRRLGNFAAADGYYSRALALREQADPRSLAVANTLNNLGVVAKNRGDLAAAERHYRRALEVKLQRSDDPLEPVAAMGNLVNLAYERGEFADAVQRQREVIARVDAHAPDSELAATAYITLGLVQRDSGQLELAEAAFSRAAAIDQVLGAERARAGHAQAGLGEVYERRGDWARAGAFHANALRIRVAGAPDSLEAADSHYAVARVELASGRPAAARVAIDRALVVQSRLAPDSTGQAEMRNLSGRIARASAQPARALQDFTAAVDAIEAQLERLGGSDAVKAGFRDRFERLYKDLAEQLLESGDEAGAFEVIERFRGQQLVLALAQRRVRLDQDLPTELVDQQRELNLRRDRAFARLARAGANADRIDAIQVELAELRDAQQVLVASIRRANPRLAAVRYPAPVVLATVQAGLTSEEALLTYTFIDDRLHLWVVDRERATHHLLEPTLASIGDEVGRMRSLLQTRSAATEEVGIKLYDWLIAPVRPRLAQRSRLIIVPEHQLHLLPFAALHNGSGWLVETFELLSATSATSHLLAEQSAGPVASSRVAAFADPAPAQSVDPAGSTDLSALPWAQIEVSNLTRAMNVPAEIFIGSAANEVRVKSLHESLSVLHFATHAVLNQAQPMESFVLLSPAGDDNGLLQAWEIFEQLRLDVGLVALSACSSAVGRLSGSEGSYGLARAFQYAGARSVLASLWQVSDRSTALFTSRFYAALRSGQTASEALRTAQLALLRAPLVVEQDDGFGATLRRWFGRERSFDARHPFHWAAFTLSGDGNWSAR